MVQSTLSPLFASFFSVMYLDIPEGGTGNGTGPVLQNAVPHKEQR